MGKVLKKSNIFYRKTAKLFRSVKFYAKICSVALVFSGLVYSVELKLFSHILPTEKKIK